MILTAFLRALGQLGDPTFRRVLALGLGLTVALLVAATWLFMLAIRWLLPDTLSLPWIGPVGGIDTALSWGAVPLMLVLSVFLMVPVASAFTGLFLDDVAAAVEARHYPALPPAPSLPWSTQVADAAAFLGLLVAVNAVALVVYLISGPFAPLVFWGVNGVLLGREYIQVAAMRRLGRQGARDLRRRHPGTIWLAGVLMAVPLTVPVVNLLVPVLGAATFTHIFHALNARR